MKQDELAFARSMVAVEPRLKTKGRYHWLRDGLYRVTSRPRNGVKPFCAGFMIKEGKIVRCAPILKPKIHRWINRGEFIMPI